MDENFERYRTEMLTSTCIPERRFQCRSTFLEAPPGIHVDAKTKLVKEVCAALDEVCRVPDTLIFLREWPLENVSQDGPKKGDGSHLYCTSTDRSCRSSYHRRFSPDKQTTRGVKPPFSAAPSDRKMDYTFAHHLIE